MTKLGDPLIQEKLERKIKLKSFLKSNRCVRGEVRAESELEKVEEFLSETCAARNVDVIKNHLNQMENLDGTSAN
jgi:phage-related protein